MFGLDFLFGAALLGLPLAGAPLLLHLLFRRKSPTVQFSTLRFIRQSIQQTAARRRLHRWMLLACRILLLALLIWTIAQPVKRLQASWTGAARSSIAAIVADTSYSMQLRDADVSLLQREDRMVQDLLRNELKDARVAIFTTREGASDGRERLATANSILSEWAPLSPQVGSHPLADRVAAARALLERNSADQKWLVLLSDLQTKEFPHPLENLAGERTVLIDLHPAIARSAGIVNLALNPPQPIPGVGSELAIDSAGRSGESRAISIRLSKPTGEVLLQPPPVMANFAAGGHAIARLPIKLPAEPWVVIEARFADQDAMPWDDSRNLLVHLPAREAVRVMDFGADATAMRFVKLALDPSEGKMSSWPLMVRAGETIGDDDRVAIVLLGRWPDASVAQRLEQFGSAGRTIILFVQPGIETLWKSLPPADRAAWQKLLPSEPADGSLSSPAHVLPPATDQSFLADVTTGADLQSAQVHRLVRFDPNARDVQTLLSVSSGTASKSGLLFRKAVGSGEVFTLSTFPDSRYTNLATHPIFLPLLVRMAMQSSVANSTVNAQMGESLAIPRDSANGAAMTIESPAHATFQVPFDKQSNRYVFNQSREVGLYTWRAGGAIVGYANVQPPADESELSYREASSVVPRADNVIVVHSLDEMRQKLASLVEPEPEWSVPMAIVLILLCVEALLGSLPGIGLGTGSLK